MRLNRGFFEVERKAEILIPVRLANRKEIKKLIYGTAYCPACDCQVIGDDIMNKLPIINPKDHLQGWMCSICNSEFDLNDNIVYIGDFDIFSQDIGEA